MAALPVAVLLAVTALCAAALVPVGGRAWSAVRVADLIWDELADCESGGDWRADTGNGYYGGLQIWAPTWTEAGGLRFADRPDHATRREQTTVGEEILRRQGWEAWPDCARELGLVG
ncbi:transglycosylase family protein [Kitasatospora sp. NPDC057936]|uniref:transglycosylase family protein n=1 Tax=Kitasatospora sp. NPDC057936 TaxID=3346283 RepID=UPI0036DBD998